MGSEEIFRIKTRLLYLLFAGLITTAFILWCLKPNPHAISTPPKSKAFRTPVKEANLQYSDWPDFDATVEPSSEECLQAKDASIDQITSIVSEFQSTALCRSYFDTFHTVYTVYVRWSTRVIDSEEFKLKVNSWLGNNTALMKEVYNQKVTIVFNEYTREETVFNPLRSKRPITAALVSDLDYIEQLHKTSSENCDFCHFQKFTARDADGRLENRLAITASNVFTFDEMHEMVMPRQHHPIKWTQEEFTAMFDLALLWFSKQNKARPTYSYPVILWDLLPHGGASQVHPHLHLILEPNRYYGIPESWRLAAEQYFRDTNRNYFTDLVDLHTALGLSIKLGDAIAIALLTPKKENEIVILSKDASADFFKLIYLIIRAFLDVKKQYCFSMGIALPQMKSGSTLQHGVIPAFARIVTRGSASEVRSDISSVELFGFYNVNSDPFSLAHEIRQIVEKKAG